MRRIMFSVGYIAAVVMITFVTFLESCQNPTAVPYNIKSTAIQVDTVYYEQVEGRTSTSGFT